MSTYLAFTIRALLTSPIFRPALAAMLDKEECDKLCLLALKAELWTHYKRRRATDVNWSKKGSEVGIVVCSVAKGLGNWFASGEALHYNGCSPS